MLAPHTLAKIRQLALVTKRLLDGPLVGDDVSAHRGYGVELDQLREYQFGDDVRFIDFKSSCRLDKMMVKECMEERNRRIILAVDVSSSAFYGSQVSRFATIQDAAAILAFAAYHARDSVGLILFSHELECVIEPANTQRHFNWLLQKLYQHPMREHATTDMVPLLTHVAQHWRKDAAVFIISDFIVDDSEQALRAAAACVDLVAVRCYDPAERALPFAGYLTVEDIEHGTHALIDGKAKTNYLRERLDKQDAFFAQHGIDVLDVAHDQDVCMRLITFFRRRMLAAPLRAW